MGRLPGQLTKTIKFSVPPQSLDPGPSSKKPFGKCRGWRDWHTDCESGFATDDVFYLELCVYNQICTHGERLFTLGKGEAFTCKVNVRRFNELRDLLLETPDWGAPRGE